MAHLAVYMVMMKNDFCITGSLSCCLLNLEVFDLLKLFSFVAMVKKVF